jgi:hypothetical protein
MSSSISRARPHPRCATRTGRCITICRSLGQRAGSCRSPGSTSPSSEHKTRSLRTGCRRKPEDGQRHWGALGGPLTAFRTETLTAIRSPPSLKTQSDAKTTMASVASSLSASSTLPTIAGSAFFTTGNVDSLSEATWNLRKCCAESLIDQRSPDIGSQSTCAAVPNFNSWTPFSSAGAQAGIFSRWVYCAAPLRPPPPRSTRPICLPNRNRWFLNRRLPNSVGRG